MRPEIQQAIDVLKQDRPGALDRALALLRDTVFSFSMKVCGNRQDAEDNTQETLVRTLPHLNRFDSGRALAVWLYKVARSRCLMKRRRAGPVRHLSLEELMPDRLEMERLANRPDGSPERALAGKELHRRILEILETLPPAYRTVLVLHDMEGLTAGEVARVMDLRPGTVRVRLHRARVFVRNQVNGTPGVRRRRGKAPVKRPARCRRLFAALSEYLEERLDPGLCAEMERHLDDCPPCRAFLKSLEQTLAALRRRFPRRMPRRQARRLHDAVLAEYRRALARRGRKSVPMYT